MRHLLENGNQHSSLTHWLFRRKQREITVYFKLSDNEIIIYHTWDAANTMLKGKFIALNNFTVQEKLPKISPKKLEGKNKENEKSPDRR